MRLILLILVFVSSFLLASTTASTGISTKRQDILKLIGTSHATNGKFAWIELNGEDYGELSALSKYQIKDIHQDSLNILRDLGKVFLDGEVLDILKKQGAEVEQLKQLVKFPPELVDEYTAKAPDQFTLHARNPEHSIRIGDNWITYSMVSSMPNVSNLNDIRLVGNFNLA